MKPSEVIREARNVLFERGWHQGHFEGPDQSVCSRGAINVVANRAVYQLTNDPHCSSTLSDQAATFVGRAAGVGRWDAVAGWNDAAGRKFDEVVEAFDKAEKLALIAEESA